MLKSIVGSLLLLVSFQVLAGSDSGTAIFRGMEAGTTSTTRFEYLNETTARMNMAIMISIKVKPLCLCWHGRQVELAILFIFYPSKLFSGHCRAMVYHLSLHAL